MPENVLRQIKTDYVLGSGEIGGLLSKLANEGKFIKTAKLTDAELASHLDNAWIEKIRQVASRLLEPAED